MSRARRRLARPDALRLARLQDQHVRERRLSARAHARTPFLACACALAHTAPAIGCAATAIGCAATAIGCAATAIGCAATAIGCAASAIG
eukprot:5891472-Pleurochrysis_carterae.AAC.1